MKRFPAKLAETCFELCQIIIEGETSQSILDYFCTYPPTVFLCLKFPNKTFHLPTNRFCNWDIFWQRTTAHGCHKLHVNHKYKRTRNMENDFLAENILCTLEIKHVGQVLL